MNWGYSGRPATKEDIFACVGPGWKSLLDNLVDELLVLGWDGTIMQVKEKFGGLRFYIGAGSDEVHDVVRKAEAASTYICETCGEPGQLVTRGWWHTACPKHYQEGDAEFLAEEEKEY